jgi:hypothetical protein
MKNLFLSLLLVLPFLSFGQLGKTPDEIVNLLGKDFTIDNTDGILSYSYNFTFDYLGTKTPEKYTFVFGEVDGEICCINWMVFRPLETMNTSYFYLEDYFKLNDSIYLDKFDKEVMQINIYRQETYYFINIKYKNGKV